ncbi:MAG TPA: ABC transporter permease subunit [Vicinamibacterales bacterium]|nr:ABC transporter permease subunit [Vicinamibacterales bacterium]
MKRILALVAKDFAELRHSPGIFVPALLTGMGAILYPFAIAVIIPAVTGERLSDSADFEIAELFNRTEPAIRGLSAEGAIQAFIFQQALALLVGITTVTGGMSVAAHSVIGEKQARTLEPLLATPLRTGELLAAKVISAAVPGVVLTICCFVAYVVLIAIFAEPRVWTALLTARSLGLVFLVGPLAALLGLQLAVCASSRVNDPRSAQQLGAVVLIIPIGVLQVAQFVGGVVLSGTILMAIAAVLAAGNLLVLRAAVSLFDRESILIRWK